MRYRNHCELCGHSIKGGFRWCSIDCKVKLCGILLFAFRFQPIAICCGLINLVTQADNAEGGPRRPVAQTLVALAAAGQFGPPVLPKDRFCFNCRLAYSSVSCPDHLLHGHHLQHLAAGADAIKTVVRFDGWAAPCSVCGRRAGILKPDNRSGTDVYKRTK